MASFLAMALVERSKFGLNELLGGIVRQCMRSEQQERQTVFAASAVQILLYAGTIQLVYEVKWIVRERPL